MKRVERGQRRLEGGESGWRWKWGYGGKECTSGAATGATTGAQRTHV